MEHIKAALKFPLSLPSFYPYLLPCFLTDLFTCLLIYLLTHLRKYLLTYSMEQSPTYSLVLLEKLTGSQLVKKFSAFYGTQRFITAFTRARHLSLSWDTSIQSILPHPTSWKYSLISSSHLGLGFSSGLFLHVSSPKTLYTPLLFPIHATFPAHLILLDFVTRRILGEENRSSISS
jgi:hypothetical protein